jgi:hypothetical protein
MIEGCCVGAGLKPAPTAASLVGVRHCGAPQKTRCVFWGPRLALFQYAPHPRGRRNASPLRKHATGTHCGAMPSCLMILPHLSASARVKAASSSGLDRAVSTAMSSMRFFKQATPKRSGAALLRGQWKGNANALRVFWAGIVGAPAVRQRVRHNFSTPHKLRKPPPIGGRASENA